MFSALYIANFILIYFSLGNILKSDLFSIEDFQDCCWLNQKVIGISKKFV